jgi:hypothetical protein
VCGGGAAKVALVSVQHSAHGLLCV